MNVLVSWARKEAGRLRSQKPRALLLPPKSQSSVEEIEIAVDIQCAKCRIRMEQEMSKMEGLESLEVNILEKKVKLVGRSMTNK